MFLLLASCLASAWLLFMGGGEPPRRIRSFTQVDSLLQQNFREYHILPDQVDSYYVRVDSTFRRRVFTVSLPGSFSKSQLHARIHRTFHGYGLDSPARVIFPQQDMEIQLIYRNTVVRTVQLRTDPDMILNRNLATVMVAFHYPPDRNLQRRFRDMGETIQPVMVIQNPIQAGSFRQEWEGPGSDPIVWLWNGETEDPAGAGITLPAGLQQIGSALPEARVLDFQSGDASPESRRTLSRYSFDPVPAAGARILHAGMDRQEFMEELDDFAAAAENGERPLLIVMAQADALGWLGEKLTEYKRGGLALIPPPDGP